MTRDYKELLRCLRLHSECYACTDNCICWDAEKRGFGTCSEELAKLAADAIEELLTSAQPEQQWIPVKNRPMDSEEREYWEDHFGYELEDEDAVMFDCPMPDDGQVILISFRKWIDMDKCEIDCGCYGLEGNGDWEGVIAWMQLPEPYEEHSMEEHAGAGSGRPGGWESVRCQY